MAFLRVATNTNDHSIETFKVRISIPEGTGFACAYRCIVLRVKEKYDMIGPNENDAMKGMTPVFCSFGKEAPSRVLALLVSPERYTVLDRDHLIVIIPTAPVPFGGAMMFIPVENVVPAGMPIDGLMSMYLSMGATAGQFMKTPAPADDTTH